ncbi:MAG: ArgR family transcriptional regulator [Coriobacteriales bacterium]|nr:ArgR family transcriptional regulator [Coriobacteriales bacterium]
MKRRSGRQETIKWIVRNKAVRTQRDLVLELREAGYTCTQATISRDIADMGLRKLPEGVYVLAEDLHLQRMVSEFVTDIESVNNQVVIRTQPGTAPGVAAAIDAADLTDVIGSIAGNDTVLAISRSSESAAITAGLIRKLRNV